MHPDDIKTKAGKELFKRINMIYGSSVWGEVLRGIIEIEREAMITCHNANVIHNIYPEGLEVPKHMMNPNIGGWLKLKDYEDDSEFDPSIQQEIWDEKGERRHNA